MNIPSIGALNTGSDFHLLDHIAPLAALLDIPLVVTEEKNFHLARHYYPHVATERREDLEFSLQEFASRFDALIECKYWLPHLKGLFERLYNKKMRLIFCPHGQSDKGFSAPLLAPYALQDIVLLYGDLLIEMLQTLDLWSSISHYAKVGNYRMLHYKKYKPFYDDLAEKEIFSHLRPNHPTSLYAPTWQDADQSTSFFDQGIKTISELSSDINLIIKVHPLLEQRNPTQYYSTLRLLDRRPHTFLVDTFPPVHPILSRVDTYIGDFSSVGYDFLFFNRPMFFLPHPTLSPGRLQTCAQDSQSRKALYNHAFASVSEKEIRKSIYELLENPSHFLTFSRRR